MPIDDVLEKIKIESNKNTKYERTCFKLLESYVSVVSKEYSDKKSVSLGLGGFKEIKEYVKFTNECKIKLIDIPKQKIIEIIDKRPGPLKTLLNKTDLANYIPNQVSLHQSGNTVLEKVKNILGYASWSELEKFSEYTFLIPSMKFMSLFIKEGEKLREYVKITGDFDRQILTSYSNDETYVDKDFEPFLMDELIKFHKKTGMTEIKSMIEEVDELKNLIDLCGNGKLPIMELKQKLFAKLKEYNPLLTYVEGEKNAH